MSLCGCGSGKPAVMKSGTMCRGCWGKQNGAARRLYKFTPELTRELCAAYAKRKYQRKDALDVLVKKTRWPRHAFKAEAARLGISRGGVRRAWKPEELQFLRDHLGDLSIGTIAKRLHRGHNAVTSKAENLMLSRRARKGFNIRDLTQIFGRPYDVVHRWLDAGKFGPTRETNAGERVSDDSVTRFIRKNPDLIDLTVADQTFLKGVLWPSLGRRVLDDPREALHGQ